MTPLIIYIHGFNSSPQSVKARILGRAVAQLELQCDYQVPALSHWPQEAMAQLETLISQAEPQPVLLVGSSLGGYYATWLTEHHARVRAVLVNPAVRPYELLHDYLGENQNLYTGERYRLTPDHMAQLKALDVPQLVHPERLLLLQQTADETLDYRQAISFYRQCAGLIQPGGSHGFDEFEQMLPMVLQWGGISSPPLAE